MEDSEPYLRAIGDQLLKLFDADFAPNPEALGAIEAQGTSLYALTFNQERLDAIFRLDRFPVAELMQRVVKGFRLLAENHRRQKLQGEHVPPIDANKSMRGPFPSAGHDILRTFGRFLGAAKAYAWLAEAEVIELLWDDDVGYHASNLILAFPEKPARLVDPLLDLMAAKGLGRIPGRMDEVMTAILAEQPLAFDSVIRRFTGGNAHSDSGEGNLRNCVLRVFTRIPAPLPRTAQQAILNLVQASPELDQLVAGIEAMGKCMDLRAQSTILLRSFLEHENSDVRLATVKTLAMLGVDDPELVAQACRVCVNLHMLDPSARPKALEALRPYGPHLTAALQQLLELGNQGLCSSDPEFRFMTTYKVAGLLAVIENASPDVISFLQKIVRSPVDASISAHEEGIRALGNFGSAARPALDAVCEYLLQFDYEDLEGSWDFAELHVQVLRSIAGDDAPIVRQHFEFLAQSEDEFAREIGMRGLHDRDKP